MRTLPGGRTLEVQRRVVDRQLEARWEQRGDSLTVELVEHRRCQVVERVAEMRESTDVRRADAAIYFEYGLAAVLLGLAAFSFARPELFAVQQRNADQRLYRETKTGYSLGGVFMGLGAAALGAGVYDSVRARDRVHRHEAVGLRPGPSADCEAPMLPASQRQLELQLGAHRGRGVTDLEGHVRFTLPGPELWPEAEGAAMAVGIDGAGAAMAVGIDGASAAMAVGIDGASAAMAVGNGGASTAMAVGLDGASEPPRTWKGLLRAGQARDMAIEVVVPYDATVAAPKLGVTRSASL